MSVRAWVWSFGFALVLWLALLAVVCLLALVWPWGGTPEAQAHHTKVAGVPIHKVWSTIKDALTDPPARPGPATVCNKDNEGDIVEIFDPIIKRFVGWECRCPDWLEDCRWFRIWTREKSQLEFLSHVRKQIWDKHRWPGCDAIVCLATRNVKHWWPVAVSQGDKL